MYLMGPPVSTTGSNSAIHKPPNSDANACTILCLHCGATGRRGHYVSPRTKSGHRIEKINKKNTKCSLSSFWPHACIEEFERKSKPKRNITITTTKTNNENNKHYCSLCFMDRIVFMPLPFSMKWDLAFAPGGALALHLAVLHWFCLLFARSRA